MVIGHIYDGDDISPDDAQITVYHIKIASMKVLK